MDFSSSSDAELEEELSRNFRRERREQRGIVRTPSSTRTQARHHTMSDGRSIEIRKGCIYIPSRDMYVHVLRALRSPECWFGDGRVPVRRRPALAPELVQLLRVSDRADARGQDALICLTNATENGFYVFQAVQAGGFPASLPAAPTRLSAVACAHSLAGMADPLTNTRFQRIMQRDVWNGAVKHPPALREHQYDVLRSSQVTLHSHEVFCRDETLGFLWKFDAQTGTLGGLCYVAETAAFVETPFTTLDFPRQACVGMQLSCGEEEERCLLRCRLIIVGVTHLAFVSLAVRPGQPPKNPFPHVTLTRMQTVALRLPNVTCWGTHGNGAAREFPDVWIGAGRTVSTFSQQEGGPWRKSRGTAFATTDITALVVRAATPSAPSLAVAGLRNGTLQLLDDGAHRHGAFDTTARHRGSDVQFLFAVPDAPCCVVSIARDGEAKVWDVRFLCSQRDPVITLLTSRPDGGQAGACSAALAGNVLAVSSMSTGLTCLDMPLYSKLFHTERYISPTTRIALGTTGCGSYELYSFSLYFTQRFELCG